MRRWLNEEVPCPQGFLVLVALASIRPFTTGVLRALVVVALLALTLWVIAELIGEILSAARARRDAQP